VKENFSGGLLVLVKFWWF